MMSTVPLSGTYSVTGLRAPSQDELVETYFYAVDTSFVRDLGITWAAQVPDLSQRFATGDPVILNARAARALAFDNPAAALGQTVLVGSNETLRTVVGVVEGVHVRPLMDEITPLVLRFAPGQFQNALVRARGDDMATTVADLKATWQQIGATDPLNPQPFSEILSMKYGGLQDAAYIISFVAFLAVLIAALGLLGIAAYTVETRTKEIGIRKALGASISDIVRRLSMSFIGLVTAGVVLAVPIAWFLNRFWLQAFAYRVEMGAWPFIGSIAALLTVALLVVGTQAMRAARLDPATTLRDE
jgi:putative ABC transport system permease protein